MPYLPEVPLPVGKMDKPKPAIDSEVIHKQLIDVLDHRASSTKEAVDTSPTSSYGTAHSELNEEPEVPTTPSKEPRPKNEPEPQASSRKGPKSKIGPLLISHTALKETPEAHKPTSKVQKVPVYPMTKENIKPYQVYADTSKVRPDCLSYAYLTKDEEDYIKALYENWNNTSMPPIRPEAPRGTTLNSSLNYYSFDTMQRVPPWQLFRCSNFRCVQMLSDWEANLASQDTEPGSSRDTWKNTNIHICRELREEILAHRPQVEETISTGILLGRAAWQHEAFKQVESEREKVRRLQTELAKEREDKSKVEVALTKMLDDERASGHVDHLEKFAEHLNKEYAENHAVLSDWDEYQETLKSTDKNTPGRLQTGMAMVAKVITYIQNRKTGLEEEKDLLGKFVNIRAFKHDKGNLICVTMAKIVESLAFLKSEVETRLDEEKKLLACNSTVTSPGLPGLPSPPPGAAMYDTVEAMEEKIAKTEAELLHVTYQQGVAETFQKYWRLYYEAKFDRGEPMDLEDDFEMAEEAEPEYEEDDDYEEDPLDALSTAAQPDEGPARIPEEQTITWLYDLISQASKNWTDDIFRHRKDLSAKQEELDKITKAYEKTKTLLKKSEHQKSLVGAENRRLRVKVKELESRLTEYIDFMQKIGIESDKDVGTEECLYTSIQSLRSLKDENLRLKVMIDGLNGKVEKLNSALHVCEEALVPWPSANRLEESLASSLQVYENTFAQHKAWLKSIGKTKGEFGVVDEASAEKNADEKDEAGFASRMEAEGLYNPIAALGALAEGKPVLDLREVVKAMSSTQSSPRRKPPVADDEHSLAELERVERMNVEQAWKEQKAQADEQIIKEVEAMMGLTKLKQSKFVERFEDEDREYGRLSME